MDLSTFDVSSFVKTVGKRESAKRCLFGPVDHEANHHFMMKQMKITEEETRTRWNFDFLKMTPLPGKFKWEKVDENSANSVPSAYKLPQISHPSFQPLTRLSRPRTPLGQGVNVNKIRTIIAPSALKAAKRLDFSSTDSKLSEVQPTDFFRCDESQASQSNVISSQPIECQMESPEKSGSKKRKLQQTAISGEPKVYINSVQSL